MKILSLAFLSILLRTCDTNTNEDKGPVTEANAIVFNNNLAVDGCAEHISLVDSKGEVIKTVLPNEASNAMFKNLLIAEIAKLPEGTYTGNIEIPVVLTYKTTQEKGELICGWGKKYTVDIIEIVNITKK